MKEEKFPFERTKRNYPALWEEGGSGRNTGSAQIICNFVVKNSMAVISGIAASEEFCSIDSYIEGYYYLDDLHCADGEFIEYDKKYNTLVRLYTAPDGLAKEQREKLFYKAQEYAYKKWALALAPDTAFTVGSVEASNFGCALINNKQFVEKLTDALWKPYCEEGFPRQSDLLCDGTIADCKGFLDFCIDKWRWIFTYKEFVRQCVKFSPDPDEVREDIKNYFSKGGD